MSFYDLETLQRLHVWYIAFGYLKSLREINTVEVIQNRG
jgi:hypothetical protein